MFYGNGRFFVAFLKIKDKTNKTFMVEIYRRKKKCEKFTKLDIIFTYDNNCLVSRQCVFCM